MIDVFGGIALAFNTSAKVTTEFMGESPEDDIKDETKSTDFGIPIGVGITIPAGEKINVVIDGRYTFGLTKIPDVSPSLDLKNAGFAFLVGISFPVGGSSS